MIELETLKKKIIYRANYRGTKEMDILLSKFVDKYINTFSKKELEDLFDFLNLEDEIIYNYYQTKKINQKMKKNKVIEIFSEFKL
jgi:antitoxin CptB